MGRQRPKHRSAPESTKHTLGATVQIGLLLTAVSFIVTRAFIFFALRPMMSDVGDVYFEYAARAFDLGHTPYQGDFVIEYPPAAWWTIAAPRLVAGGRMVNSRDVRQLEPVYNAYRFAYRGLMLICDAASLVLVWLIAKSRRPGWETWAAITYTLATAILAHLLYDRLDTGLLLLLMAWARCWTHTLEPTDANSRSSSAEPSGSLAWTAAAFLVLGLGISFKLTPILAVPFLLLSEWHSPRRWTRLSLAIVALVASAALPFAVQYAVSGPGVFALFGYHGLREIQIESLYSTLMMVASLFGTATIVTHSHGAYEMSGDLAAFMKVLSTAALLGFLAATGLWALLRGSRYRRADAYCLACFVMSATVILANVLSPQYFIWSCALIILLAVEVLPSGRAAPSILTGLLLTTMALTTWIVPHHYFRTPETPLGLIPLAMTGMTAPSAVACVVLGLRNAIYLGIVIWLGVLFIRRRTSRS